MLIRIPSGVQPFGDDGIDAFSKKERYLKKKSNADKLLFQQEVSEDLFLLCSNPKKKKKGSTSGLHYPYPVHSSSEAPVLLSEPTRNCEDHLIPAHQCSNEIKNHTKNPNLASKKTSVAMNKNYKNKKICNNQGSLFLPNHIGQEKIQVQMIHTIYEFLNRFRNNGSRGISSAYSFYPKKSTTFFLMLMLHLTITNVAADAPAFMADAGGHDIARRAGGGFAASLFRDLPPQSSSSISVRSAQSLPPNEEHEDQELHQTNQSKESEKHQDDGKSSASMAIEMDDSIIKFEQINSPPGQNNSDEKNYFGKTKKKENKKLHFSGDFNEETKMPTSSPTERCVNTKSKSGKSAISCTPSNIPSSSPSAFPSVAPSPLPTNEPSSNPSILPTTCVDEEGWRVGGSTVPYKGKTCADISKLEHPRSWCNAIFNLIDGGHLNKHVHEACCACQGSTFQSSSPSSTPSSNPSASAHPTLKAESDQCIDDPDWLFDVENTMGCAHLRGEFGASSVCESISHVMFNDKSADIACCACGGGLHKTVQPSIFPSKSSNPSNRPSLIPSVQPSKVPSSTPSEHPTGSPSSVPTQIPSLSPSSYPSHLPSKRPTNMPSSTPSSHPTDQPSVAPTLLPSLSPSLDPSSNPSIVPSTTPSSPPSSNPSICVDEEDFRVGGTVPPYAGMSCGDIKKQNDPTKWCQIIGDLPDAGHLNKRVHEACCVCSGSTFQSSSPSSFPTSHPSVTNQPSSFEESGRCMDDTNWKFFDSGDHLHVLGCADLLNEDACDRVKNIVFEGKRAKDACCVCSGGEHRTLPPSAMPSSSIPPTMTPSEEASDIPSLFPSVGPSECKDSDDWRVKKADTSANNIYEGMTCDMISQSSNPEAYCEAISNTPGSVYERKSVRDACCACGGSNFKTTRPSLSPSDKPSLSQMPSMNAYPSSVPTSTPSSCENEPHWYFDEVHNLGCESLEGINSEQSCEQFGNIVYNDKTAFFACCACNGGRHLSVPPSSNPTETISPSIIPSVSTTPSIAPSTQSPTTSLEPSEQPSSTHGTIFDGDLCGHAVECHSGACELSFDISSANAQSSNLVANEVPQTSQDQTCKAWNVRKSTNHLNITTVKAEEVVFSCSDSTATVPPARNGLCEEYFANLNLLGGNATETALYYISEIDQNHECRLSVQSLSFLKDALGESMAPSLFQLSSIDVTIPVIDFGSSSSTITDGDKNTCNGNEFVLSEETDPLLSLSLGRLSYVKSLKISTKIFFDNMEKIKVQVMHGTHIVKEMKYVGSYTLKYVNENYERFLTVDGNLCNNGDNVNLRNSRDDKRHQLFFTGENGKIHSALCGRSKALDIIGGSCDNNANIALWDSHGLVNQQWTFGEDGSINSVACPGSSLGVTSNVDNVYLKSNTPTLTFIKQSNINVDNDNNAQVEMIFDSHLLATEIRITNEGDLQNLVLCEVEVSGIPANKYCAAPNFNFVLRNDGIKTASFYGQYGENQDTSAFGGIAVQDDGSLEMHQNAWKTYKLQEPIIINKYTRLEFDFRLTGSREAEGHAFCLDEDKRIETNGSMNIRCVAFAGHESHYWSNTLNINYALGKEAHQSSNLGTAIASKANDGKKEQMWVPLTEDGMDFNSISETGAVSNTPWWEVLLGGTGTDFDIHSVVIYPRLNTMPIRDFDVIAYNDNNLVRRISVKNAGESIIKVKFVDGNNRVIANKIRIEMHDLSFKRTLSLAEVEVYGVPLSVIQSDDYQPFIVKVGEMFSKKTTINYISFIQDIDVINPDRSGSTIVSTFKNLKLYDEFPTSISDYDYVQSTVEEDEFRSTLPFQSTRLIQGKSVHAEIAKGKDVATSQRQKCKYYAISGETSKVYPSGWQPHDIYEVKLKYEVKEYFCDTHQHSDNSGGLPPSCNYVTIGNSDQRNLYDDFLSTFTTSGYTCRLTFESLRKFKDVKDIRSHKLFDLWERYSEPRYGMETCTGHCDYDYHCGSFKQCWNAGDPSDDSDKRKVLGCSETIANEYAWPFDLEDWNFCYYNHAINTRNLNGIDESNNPLLTLSTRTTNAAEKVTDGDTSTCNGDENVIGVSNPSLTVDLGREYLIDSIKIQTNPNYDDSFDELVVIFIDDNGNEVASYSDLVTENNGPSLQVIEMNFVHCVKAKKIMLKKNGTKKLVLCEVTAFGSPLEELTTGLVHPTFYNERRMMHFNAGKAHVIHRIILPIDQRERSITLHIFEHGGNEVRSSRHSLRRSSTIDVTDFGFGPGNGIVGIMIEMVLDDETQEPFSDDIGYFEVYAGEARAGQGGSTRIYSPNEKYYAYAQSDGLIPKVTVKSIDGDYERILQDNKYYFGTLFALADNGWLVAANPIDYFGTVDVLKSSGPITTNAGFSVESYNSLDWIERTAVAVSWTSGNNVIYAEALLKKNEVKSYISFDNSGSKSYFWVDGKVEKIDFSEDGKSIAISIPETTPPSTTGLDSAGSIQLWTQSTDDPSIWRRFTSPLYGKRINQHLGRQGIVFTSNPSPKVYIQSTSSAIESYELTANCQIPDSRAISNTGSSDLADALVCACKPGYVSSSGGIYLVEKEDFCTPCSLSKDTIINANRMTFSGVNTMTFDESRCRLTLRDASDIPHPIDLVAVDDVAQAELFSVSEDDNDAKQIFDIGKLQPGGHYKLDLFEKRVTPPSHPTLQCPFVASCSCEDSGDEDQTGRPKSLTILQSKGHVMFSFDDASRCREAYAFTRLSGSHEFLSGLDEVGVSFTDDYTFIPPGKACGTHILPGTDASDDLSVSDLNVGRAYTYCVRAVKSPLYMAYAYESMSQSRSISSSLSTCKVHKVLFESSINGLITTPLNAGSLPIEDVVVSWELLSDDKSTALKCSGCSGTVKSTKGGAFHINIKGSSEELVDKNEDEIPIRIKYGKMTEANGTTIRHIFLKNDGADVCNPVEGDVEFVSHLQFNKPLHIYDDTSVPFYGKVIVSDTEYEGAEGCPISGAEVCLMHQTAHNLTEELVCVKTDSDGRYVAAVVIGSVVQSVDVFYHSHDFAPTKENSNDYGVGIEVLPERAYIGNDFRDLSKAKLFVEVAGGKCDTFIGNSAVQIGIPGCGWTKELSQDRVREVHNGIPAALLEAQILNVTDEDGATINHITQSFRDPLVLRTIDLRDVEDKALDDAIAKNNEDISDTDTGIDRAAGIEDVEEVKQGEELKETVRFQFDGTLIVDFSVDETYDELACTNYTVSEELDSFHVVDYMTVIEVTIKLKLEIVKDKVYCEDVDREKYKIQIESNLGMDTNAGFTEFYNQLQTPREKELLALCSTIKPPGGTAHGACNLPVEKIPDGSGSGIVLLLTVGRPNISKPFTKRVITTILGADHQVRHTAGFFIEGNYKKGPGDSFALPTHQPIMILRDPPGSNSFASYTNVRTSVRVYNKEDSSHTDSNFSVKAGITFEPDTDVCAGGGLGAIVITCKETVGGETDNVMDQQYDIDSVTAKSSNSISNSFSTTWSYTTSDDPQIAGAESDVFIVPNLNVAFEEVTIVRWSNDACSPLLEDDGSFPSDFAFDVNAKSSKEALSFYSRHHIETTKLPEILDALDIQIEVLKNITNSTTAYEPELEKTTELFNAAVEWHSILSAADTTKNLAIANKSDFMLSNWFGTQQKEQYFQRAASVKESDRNEVNIDQVYSGLAPPNLINEAKQVDSNNADEDESLQKIRDTNRIQFSGSTGSYTMTLDRSSSVSYTEMSCENKDLRKVLGYLETARLLGSIDFTLIGQAGMYAYDQYKKKQALQRDLDENNEVRKKLNREIIDKYDEIQKKAEIRRQNANADSGASVANPKSSGKADSGFEQGRVKALVAAIEEKVKKNKEREEEEKRRQNDFEKRKREREKAKAEANELRAKAQEAKANQERDDERLKNRDQSNAAEKATNTKGGAGTLTKIGMKGLQFALSSAPIAIGQYLAGCDYTMSSEAEPADIDLETSVFGVGISAGLSGGFQVVIEHHAEQTDEESEDASVSFTLSDSDIDDEFVVDIYFDEIYGTFIFDTVSGRSKCIWEDGTAPSEDPSLVLLNPASSFIYPDEKMVFEVTMENKGRTGDSFFYVTQEATSLNLNVALGGSGIINENGHVIQLYRDAPVIKQIIVSRGLNKYEFPPIQLTLKSKCEADMNTRQNQDVGRYVTIPLANDVDVDGNRVLKWMEPCSKINWSGELKRERSFLINESGREELIVLVFNPLAIGGKNLSVLGDDGPLKSALLRFKEKGKVTWRTAQSTLGGDLDFLNHPNVTEDSYGYSSLIWDLGSDPNVREGTYDIIIETKCNAPDGAPDNVRGFREFVITGVYDVTPPKQYGKEIPLRRDIVFGEEIKVFFTENIWCKKPYTFDIKVTIGLDQLSTEDLQVDCRDKTIGFHFDLSKISGDLETIGGKEFTVEINNVQDSHRNTMERRHRIFFSKRFANLDLDGASTAFKFTIDVEECSDESVGRQSDRVREELASVLGLGAGSKNRIQIYSLSCVSGTQIIADAEVEPDDQGRFRRKLSRIRSNTQPRTSLALVVSLQRSTESANRNLLSAGQKRFSFNMIYSIILKPTEEDKVKFISTPEEKGEEDRLIAYASSENDDYVEEDTTTSLHNTTDSAGSIIDAIENKMALERAAIMDKLTEEKEELKALDEKMAASKKLDDERMVEMMEKLQESQELNRTFMLQGVILLSGCFVAALAAFYQFRRGS